MSVISRRGLSLALLCAIGAGSHAVSASASGQHPHVDRREASRIATLEASDADFQRGVAAQRRGDLSAAIAAYRVALVKDPHFVESMINLSRALIELRDFEEASGWLDRAAAARPEYPAIHAVRGRLALERGDESYAIDELSLAHATASDDVEVLTNLGAALVLKGLSLEAIELLDRALRLDPYREQAVLNLALAHDHAGRPARAVYYYERFLGVAPSADDDRDAVARRIAELRDFTASPVAETRDIPRSTVGAPASIEGARP